MCKNIEIKAEKAIFMDKLNEYEAGMNFFYSELVKLNIIIYLANKIFSFRFDLFFSLIDNIFFPAVMRSFYDTAVLTITRLATDQGSNLVTLRRFKNSVRKWVKPEYAESFHEQLKISWFDHEVEHLLEMAKQMRTHQIAHTTQDYFSGNIDFHRPDKLALEKMRDALNSLLQALSFNVQHMMLPLPYIDGVGRPQGLSPYTDIENILDNIAKNSILLNMPEVSQERWYWHKKLKMKEEDLVIVNSYRKKFNLPLV